jgi:Spy/CpxP family protein refolding chaperone
MMYWWKSHQARAARAASAGCGLGSWEERWWAGPSRHRHEDAGAGAFGVRRPLRYLAYRLRLDESQVAELARILNEVKTERAQAEVDDRRTVAAFADAVGSAAFDHAKASEGAALRVKTAERLRDVIVQALARIHALLDPEQRAQLAYLIRTGAVSL